MTDTRERLVRCFAAVFPELNVREIPLASPLSVGSWDSVAGITLISIIEEEFGIEVNPEDPEELASFELLRNYLENEKRISPSPDF